MQRNRAEYYQQLKVLANRVRSDFDIQGYAPNRTTLKSICKSSGVERVDLWPPPHQVNTLKKLRGAYFCDDCGCSIMVSRTLPDEPAIFTLAHELKHHLVDQDLLSGENPALFCDESNINEQVEIGAEIFAAELIFPEQDFLRVAEGLGLGIRRCLPEDLIRLKRETATALSYAALAKRSEFFDIADQGTLSKYKGWKKLEEQLYGEPDYKRIQRYRAGR